MNSKFDIRIFLCLPVSTPNELRFQKCSKALINLIVSSPEPPAAGDWGDKNLHKGGIVN